MATSHEPIKDHPGFYRRAGSVAFRFRDTRGRRRWATAPTIAAAKRLKVELDLDVRRGDYRDRRSPRFADYAREWIDVYVGRTSRGLSEDTRDDYRKRLTADAIPVLGRLRLTEIEPRDIKAYAAEIAARGVSQNTVRLGVAPVRALLATALEEGLIRSNPAAGLRLFVQPVHSLEEVVDTEDVKALAEDQLVQFLAALRCPACARLTESVPDCSECKRWRFFFEFLSHTGLRIGEAMELRWTDVDLGARWLHVRRRFYRRRVAQPKGRKARRIRITEGLAHALWELRKQTHAADNDLLFTAGKGGRIHHSNLMSRVLKPAAVRAGLGEWVKGKRGELRAETWVGFHTFRHTCATMLFRHGWNAVQVQKFLGHSDPGFTLRTYVHLLPEDLPEPSFLDSVTAGPCDHDATRGTQAGANSIIHAENAKPTLSRAKAS